MSDLVNRLRLGDTRLSRATLNEAADRIEALEAALLHLAERLRVSAAEDRIQEMRMVMNRVAHSLQAMSGTDGATRSGVQCRDDAIEECARLVESTGLRNPDNIARDIRALSAHQKD